MAARIAPLSPPYTPEIQGMLDKWMPPDSGVEPLKLFRTIARHSALSGPLRSLGAAIRGRLGLPLRAKELIVLRSCARCGAEYEWGVHVAAFAAGAGLDEAAIHRTVQAPDAKAPSLDDADGLVLRLVDELHDAGSVGDATWKALTSHFDENALFEMLTVAGFYHLISFIVNGAGVDLEPWAATFPPATTRIEG